MIFVRPYYMNKFLTLCARAKFLHLLELGGGEAVKIARSPAGSFQIEQLFSQCDPRDIIISVNPLVVTDMDTLMSLSEGAVDFDYTHEEFIIKKGTHVLHPNA